jgi:MFS family permease
MKNNEDKNDYHTIKDTDEVENLKEQKDYGLDDVIDKIGHTRFHFWMVVIVGISLLADGIEMYLIYLIGPTLKEVFQVGDTFISCIVAALFIGMAIGALVCGKIIKHFERRTPIIVFLFLIALFGTICVVFENIYWFLFCRFIIGICVGVLMNLTNALCEVLPTYSRDMFMGSLYIFVKLGIVYWIMCYYIIIQYEYAVKAWKLIIILACIPLYIECLLAVFFYEESPRILLWNNKKAEAFVVIDQIAKGSSYVVTEEDKQAILREADVHMKQFNEHETHFFSYLVTIFTSRLIRITTLSALLWILNTLLIIGCSYALPLILKRQELEIIIVSEEHQRQVNNAFVLKILLTAVIPLPAELVAGALTSFHYFGRIKTIIIGFAFQMIFSICMIVDLERVYIYVSMISFFNVISNNITKYYTTEVYNTMHRDSGYGFSNFAARLAAISTPFIIEGSLNISMMGPGIVLTILSVLGILVALLLPYDTYGKKLDEEKTK